jgi:Leucine-rich repeat (LRR) protein
MITLNGLFKVPGFVPDPKRDCDYEKKSGETVSQVQGSYAFCQKFLRWTRQNPGDWPDLKKVLAACPGNTTALILTAKIFGHVLRLQGNIEIAKNQTCEFEGFSETFVIHRLLWRWNAFAETGFVSQEAHEDISYALSNALWHDNCSKPTLKKVLHDIIHNHAGSYPIVVGTGWVWHSIYTIFYTHPEDSRNAIRIAFCNRGADCGTQSGIVFLKVKDRSKITLRFLEILASRIGIEHSEYMSLKWIKEFLEAEETLYVPMKTQKSGNCTFANLKAAVYALLRITLPPSENPEENAQGVYKHFVAYDANETLTELAQDFPLTEMLLAPIGYYERLASIFCNFAFGITPKPKKVDISVLQKIARSIEASPSLNELTKPGKLLLLSKHVTQLIKDRAPLTPLVDTSYFLKPVEDYFLITELNLTKMGLQKFPPQITICTRLTKLYLNENLFQSIPPEIKLFTALQHLECSSNSLSIDLKEIKRLTSLQTLYLNFNKIDKLPSKITRLIHLKTLGVAYNQISEFPEVIGSLGYLESLGLNGNQIQAIPPAIIRSLTNLQGLYLAHNQITSIPIELFQNCTKLKNLSLANNQIKSLSKKVRNLTDLVYLNLKENRLIDVPLKIIQCSRLQILDLQGNTSIQIPDLLRDFYIKNKLSLFK